MNFNSTIYAEHEYSDVADVASHRYLSLQNGNKSTEAQGARVRLHWSFFIMSTIPASCPGLVFWKKSGQIFHTHCKVIDRYKEYLKLGRVRFCPPVRLVVTVLM